MRKKPTGAVYIAEKDLLDATGYTKKALQNLRNGAEDVRGVVYPPVLIEGVHWVRSGIIYTPAGVKIVMRRRRAWDKKNHQEKGPRQPSSPLCEEKPSSPLHERHPSSPLCEQEPSSPLREMNQ